MSSLKSCPLEQSLCTTKSKQCYKVVKCETECDPIVCCPEVPTVDPCACVESLDCCTLAHQRLSKLQAVFANSAAGASYSTDYLIDYDGESSSTFDTLTLMTRDGNTVTVPTSAFFTASGYSGSNIVGFFDLSGTTSGDSGHNQPSVSGVFYANAALAYGFVQSMRYAMYRDVVCDTKDQVLGFFINTNRELQVLQDLSSPLSPFGLTYTDTLQYYDSKLSSTMTVQDKNKLTALNTLYDMGLSLIMRVNFNPKTEGDILEATDRCGQKYLALINTADRPTSTGYRPGVNGFVIVACRIKEVVY